MDDRDQIQKIDSAKAKVIGLTRRQVRQELVRRLYFLEEDVSDTVEELVTIVRQADFAERHEQMAVAAKPGHVAAIEDHEPVGILLEFLPPAEIPVHNRGKLLTAFAVAG